MHICITHMGHTCHSYVPVPTVLVIMLYECSHISMPLSLVFENSSLVYHHGFTGVVVIIKEQSLLTH